jgi:hypothetical protein
MNNTFPEHPRKQRKATRSTGKHSKRNKAKQHKATQNKTNQRKYEAKGTNTAQRK